MTGVTEQLDGVSTVLLATPSIGDDRRVCSSLVTRGDPEGVLFVTYTRSPEECLAQLGDTGASIDTVGVVSVGDTTESLDREDVASEAISSPTDMTGLGIAIGQSLSEWDSPVAVCFDSLTSMLQYVDFETAFEFLHTVIGQIHAADGRVHFHIDPDAHDDAHVAAIASLVDAYATVDDQTETQVRTRDLLAES